MKKRPQHGTRKRPPKPRPRIVTYRGSSYERGYDLVWRRFAKWYLLQNPWCSTEGCDAPANEVDHIKPLEDGGEKYDLENLSPKCKPCHSRKTVADMQRRRQAKEKKDRDKKPEIMNGAIEAAKELRERVHGIFASS